MITLQPAQGDDALALFPLIYQSEVTDTLLWDGPESLDEYLTGYIASAERVARGEKHLFTIIEIASGQPVGSASIRPNENNFKGSIGLWIGEPFHGKGYGTEVIRQLVAYGFETLGLEKINSDVFVGNWASRRIFEKNGFSLEGTIRKAVQKRGRAVSEWKFGLTREEYEMVKNSGTPWIVHLCLEIDWQEAHKRGEYRAASLEQAGFIHASRPDQIAGVIQRYYQDAPPMLLLWIDPQRVAPEIRWEGADGDVFPHIYGPLNLDAIFKAETYQPGCENHIPHK